MIEIGFIYMGIAGIFSWLSFMKPGHNDIAGVIWLSITILYLTPYGIAFQAMGIVMSLLHFNIAYEEWKSEIIIWKQKKKEVKNDS